MLYALRIYYNNYNNFYILIVDTITSIKRLIAHNYTTHIVKEYASISLSPDFNIVNSIRVESPNSEIQWSHNGIFIQNNHHRLEIKNYKIGTYNITFICSN